MLTITIIHHSSSGVSTVHMNMGAPLQGVTPPEAEQFVTKDEARAYAKQVQADLGGPDKAAIVEHDLTTKAALDDA